MLCHAFESQRGLKVKRTILTKIKHVIYTPTSKDRDPNMDGTTYNNNATSSLDDYMCMTRRIVRLVKFCTARKISKLLNLTYVFCGLWFAFSSSVLHPLGLGDVGGLPGACIAGLSELTPETTSRA